MIIIAYLKLVRPTQLKTYLHNVRNLPSVFCTKLRAFCRVFAATKDILYSKEL